MSVKISWQEIEPQFNRAAEHLEGVFTQTIRICELFEQLNLEVLKTCETDDQFFTRTNASLEVLNLITQVSNPEAIPVEVLARASYIFLQANYMLEIISRVLDAMAFQSTVPKPTAFDGGHQYH